MTAALPARQRPGNRLPALGLALASLGLLLLGLLASIGIGETSIAPAVIAQVLDNQLFGATHPLDPIDIGIVWNYRLPRGLVAATCGAGLALSGLLLQSLLRNALAEPYLLGVSAGASTGAVLVSVIGLGAGAVSLSMGAFVGALTAFVLVALLAGALRQGSAPTQVILAGIAGSQLFNAITAFLITRSANAEQARGILFWLLGNLSGVRWNAVGLALPVILLGLGICLWHRRTLDAFTFGVDAAASLGVPVRRLRLLLIGSATLMTAVMVSLVGSIGFVGLVVPHAMRLLAGPRHTRLVPLCALGGALFLMAADVLSRVLLKGQVLPIGVITALVGAPAFALLLLARRHR
ncbi:MAG: Fe(3+) dicitrate transport system permease protein FecD [Stenotrophomonas maltophilia]|nr:MAG: Fe(3+) dicitrate transport system permease protein FecD [Stenotrophomonas maltophilia]